MNYSRMFCSTTAGFMQSYHLILWTWWLLIFRYFINITFVIDDDLLFEAAYDNLDDVDGKRQVLMMQDTLKLGGGILSKIPDMIAAQIIGRLLPEIWNYPHIEKLIAECDQLR